MTKIEHYENDLADGKKIEDDEEIITVKVKRMMGESLDGRGGIHLNERSGEWHTSRGFLEGLGFDPKHETETISLITHDGELLALAEHERFEWDITTEKNISDELVETIEGALGV